MAWDVRAKMTASDRIPPQQPRYDEVKTTQAAALILKLNRRPMEYMKLVKLLYNIDRESLHRWGRAITNDEVFCLPHGMVLSITLDKAETSDPVDPTYWDRFIGTKGYLTSLLEDCGDGELSDAEVQLITELFARYKDKSPFDMEKEHHDPLKFPEWKHPGHSRITTSLSDILRALGHSTEEIEETLTRIQEDAQLTAYLSA
jgi:hypothetical protein